MDLSYIYTLHPVLLALLGGLFTWGMTALGASLVFFFKNINKTALNTMLGFAAGVMVAASFWSLLLPALEIAEENSTTPWLPVVVGFSLGGLFLALADRLIPHLHPIGDHEPEGPKSSWRRSMLLLTAITLHNIPEGLAFGVAFGLVGQNPEALMGAVALAIGMGIQNFPEGAAVSIPLRKEGFTRRQSFFRGQMSGIVEPISAVFGAWFAMSVSSVLPYALAFAAGAMIYVVVEELIPEAQSSDHHSHGATFGSMAGFLLMTFLDTALG